ncbi:hypothetical protein ABE15_32095 [Bacillus cereus]|nr:hypothetical protein [Bacillus cereus]
MLEKINIGGYLFFLQFHFKHEVLFNQEYTRFVTHSKLWWGIIGTIVKEIGPVPMDYIFEKVLM